MLYYIYFNFTIAGPIHADFNEQNILVKRSDESTDIIGVIDFQDSDFNCKVFDVSTYIMYMMAANKGDDAIEIGGYCLRGFMDNRELSQAELDVVYYGVAARFVMSLVLGLHYYNERKDPYLLLTQGGWVHLEKLWKIPSKELLRCWLSG